MCLRIHKNVSDTNMCQFVDIKDVARLFNILHINAYLYFFDEKLRQAPFIFSIPGIYTIFNINQTII